MRNSNENQPPVPPSGYDTQGSAIQPASQSASTPGEPRPAGVPSQSAGMPAELVGAPVEPTTSPVEPAASHAEPVAPSTQHVQSQQPTQADSAASYQTPQQSAYQPTQQPAAQPTAQPGSYQSQSASGYTQQPSYGQHASVPGSQQHSAYQQPYGQQPAHQQAPQQQAYQQGYQHAYQQPAYAAVAPAKSAAKPAKKGGSGKTFLVSFVGAALACVLALSGYSLFFGGSGSSGSTGTTAVIGSSTSTSVSANDEDQSLAEAVAEKALPSIASIDVYSKQSSYYGFGYGGSGSDELTQSSLGSGVVLSEDGYIITNYHVIENGTSFTATIEGEEYECEVVGSDPSSDLAVLKAKDASGLTPIELGSSSDLTIGEWVMTLGSPFGLEQSVATGIVSATSRSQIMQSESGTSIYANMIQTDAAINPGNSGGALVDSDGKLIGINTLITSSSGNYSGVGFAIPVDYAINIAQQIIEGETPTHAQLGVSLSNVDAQTAERYGLAVDKGAYISRVYSGSGAEAAGLKEGDIITKFDGIAVESASDLMLDVRSKNPGDVVTIEYNRNGKAESVEVTLGSDGSSQSSTQQNSGIPRGGSSSRGGATS